MFSVLAVNFKVAVRVERAELVRMKTAVRRKLEQTQMTILRFCDISFFLFCCCALCLLYANNFFFILGHYSDRETNFDTCTGLIDICGNINNGTTDWYLCRACLLRRDFELWTITNSVCYFWTGSQFG